MKNHVILRIESFEGQDTFIRCGSADQDFLFAIVLIDDFGKAEIIDGAYRSYEEAASAWPEASQSNASTKPVHFR